MGNLQFFDISKQLLDLLRYVIPPTVNRVSLLEGPVEAKFVCAYFCTHRRDMPSFSSDKTREVTQNRLLLKSPFLSKNRITPFLPKLSLIDELV